MLIKKLKKQNIWKTAIQNISKILKMTDNEIVEVKHNNSIFDNMNITYINYENV